MQTHAYFRGINLYIGTLLIILFFLTGFFPFTSVHADDGDFVWATAMGADESDQGHGIAVDASGNVYTTGYFRGTADFDPGPGEYFLTNDGPANATFISKLDSNGNFVWARAIGGGYNNCLGHATSVDTFGNVYITGFFWNTVDFDPGSGTSNLTSAGECDIFIVKLDSNGNFVWAKAIGGSFCDVGYGISVDSSGNVYTTGYFRGTADFDPGSATFNLTSVGVQDIFISKLDSNGNFVWAKAIGGDSEDTGYGISADSSGNVYTTGYFRGTADFDPGSATFNLTSGGVQDIFISKLDSNGNFVWAKAIGGDSEDTGYGISADSSGNVYTTGYFLGTADFDPGSGSEEMTSAGFGDVFISKLDGNGNFVWAKAIGGDSEDTGYGISADSSGNVYTTGYFRGTADFDPGSGSEEMTSAGLGDVFISKLDGNGDFVWAKAMGGTSSEYGKGIAVNSSGKVYITGYFYETADFDPGSATFNLTSAGAEDVFIVVLDGSSSFPWHIFLPAIIHQTGP